MPATTPRNDAETVSPFANNKKAPVSNVTTSEPVPSSQLTNQSPSQRLWGTFLEHNTPASVFSTRDEEPDWKSAAARAMSAFEKGAEKKTKKDSKKDKVKFVMGEYKRGKLHSGSKDGPKVKNRKQAIAIALSEAEKKAAYEEGFLQKLAEVGLIQ
jgi:hypothetical protein